MSFRVTAETVLNGYCNGLFPMGEPGGRISWYSPDPRGVFPLDDRFHVPYTLRKVIRRGVFEIRFNTVFAEVIRACGMRGEGTWITPKIVDIYTTLHRAGYAHSVECWKDGELAGGLYGVSIGAAFFGESMFRRVTDASKVALVALVEQLRKRDYRLLDTQWTTPHLLRFGAINVDREEYLAQLTAAIILPRSFTDDSPVVGVSPEEG